MAQTSSKSCSAGGVLGREGATDSAARRPIAEGIKGRGERERGGFHSDFLGKMCMSWKGSRIPEFDRQRAREKEFGTGVGTLLLV